MDWLSMREYLTPFLTGAALTGVAAHLWRRYRARMVTLAWEVFHQNVAVSADDTHFGKVEVLYNGTPVNSVYMTLFRLQNQSTRDLTAVEVNLLFQDGTTIYTATGALHGSANVLPFAARFAEAVDRFLKLAPTDPTYASCAQNLTTRRDFVIPVLNRAAVAEIALLVQAPPGKSPFLHVGCDYPGARLRMRGPQRLLLGVPQGQAAITGIVVGAGIAASLAWLVPGGAAVAAAFVVGISVAAIGAGLVRLARAVGGLLS